MLTSGVNARASPFAIGLVLVVRGARVWIPRPLQIVRTSRLRIADQRSLFAAGIVLPLSACGTSLLCHAVCSTSVVVWMARRAIAGAPWPTVRVVVRSFGCSECLFTPGSSACTLRVCAGLSFLALARRFYLHGYFRWSGCCWKAVSGAMWRACWVWLSVLDCGRCEFSANVSGPHIRALCSFVVRFIPQCTKFQDAVSTLEKNGKSRSTPRHCIAGEGRGGRARML